MRPSGTTPVLFSADLGKTYRLLQERGVSCTPIQSDGAGHSYFEIRDLDGNAMEICEED